MSQHIKRQKTSEIWNFFTPIENGGYFATCNICKKKLSFKSTNSNLKKHISSLHPTVNLNYHTTKTQDGSSFDNISVSTDLPSTSKMTAVPPSTSKGLSQMKISTMIPKKLSLPTKKLIDQKLLQLFTLDLQPFSVVEDKGFREFVKILNPSYQLPDRKVISKTLLPALYEECRNKCIQIIRNAKTVCLTTDNWSSVNTESYMAVTAHFLDENFQLKSILLECSTMPGHHTSINLSQNILKICNEWNIIDKILLVVSDNAPSIVGAIKKELQWKHFGCFAHTLNLVVKHSIAFPEVDNIIQKIKSIVGHFKRSCLSNEKLMNYQKQSGGPALKLLQAVPTRWNSVFYMLERFNQLEDAIKCTMALIDHSLQTLTAEEWKISHELCQILKPFEKVTKIISGENYGTASYVIPLINGLYDVCDLEKGLRERFENIENSQTLTICTFLDPRFKMIAFSNQNYGENTKKKVTEYITKLISQEVYEMNQPPKEEMEQQNNEEDDEISVWGTFEKAAAVNQPKGTATSRAIIEVQRYLEADILPRQENPLNWWRHNRYNYPYISQMVQKKCCAIATSVPCERLFSKAGQLLSDRRSRLGSTKVQQLLFLSSNFGIEN
ncbi:zinc finger BED domain-containing protein 4-like [Diabrotica undecimpunctata]|uniref:zinc finger BED domain-containing protein 4-like n=1 Tax=Diabrotica undecimpunctata TaxID=50387 RepID=UPI003B6338EB